MLAAVAQLREERTGHRIDPGSVADEVLRWCLLWEHSSLAELGAARHRVEGLNEALAGRGDVDWEDA